MRKHLIFFMVLNGFIALLNGCKDSFEKRKITNDVPVYSWQESDTTLKLLHDSQVVWKFNYANGKPYFSPLNTAEGRDLIWLRPVDHPWHYGLWFSWKFINEKNFWEEDEYTGKAEGIATMHQYSRTLTDDFYANMEMQINYALEDSTLVLIEKRAISVSPPDKRGNYFIDWTLHLTPQKDSVVLNRTPPGKHGGPFYGGYAGLSYRASANMTQHTYRHSSGWTGEEDLVGYGEKGEWMDLSGFLFDSKKESGLTILNHPSNGDGKVPWYIYKDGDFAFFNAALLFNNPIMFYKDETLKLRYRVLVHTDALTRLEIQEHYIDFGDIGK